MSMCRLTEKPLSSLVKYVCNVQWASLIHSLRRSLAESVIHLCQLGVEELEVNREDTAVNKQRSYL